MTRTAPENGANPDRLTPMVATTGRLPVGPDGRWAYEVKWDGVRVLATMRGDEWRLRGRPRGEGLGNDVTDRYPELAELEAVRTGDGRAGSAADPFVLDGEVVMFDDEGRPSFPALQHRMHIADPAESRRLSAERSVVMAVFDVLWTPDGPCFEATYDERRSILESLDVPGPHVVVPPAQYDDPDDFVEVCRARGLEGVVAKRRDRPYRPGRRVDHWVKAKFTQSQEFVVVGWTEGTGARGSLLGALMLAYVDDAGALTYCGKVGTGFSDRELASLRTVLAPLARDLPPVTNLDAVPAQRTAIHWVEPEVVVQVTFGEWSPSGHLRHPRYDGRRSDIAPTSVRREPSGGFGGS